MILNSNVVKTSHFLTVVATGEGQRDSSPIKKRAIRNVVQHCHLLPVAGFTRVVCDVLQRLRASQPISSHCQTWFEIQAGKSGRERRNNNKHRTDILALSESEWIEGVISLHSVPYYIPASFGEFPPVLKASLPANNSLI